MSDDRVSSLEQALSSLETRYIETQKQIGQLINAFQQLQQLFQQLQQLTLQQLSPSPTPPSFPPTAQAPPPALPSEFNGDCSEGLDFLHSCQTYVHLFSDSFSNDQTKIIWALSYMKTRRAARWASHVFKWEEENEGYTKFLDWNDFKSEFHKECCPTNSNVAVVNELKSTAYYQETQLVDDYLDEFLDLITESGYTDLKTLVVKFKRGLDPEIQDAVATMASGRPSDIAPTAWYKAAKNIDQNRASNEAFCSGYYNPPPSPIQPTPYPSIFGSSPKQEMNSAPLLSSHNHFDVLCIEQINDIETETQDMQKPEIPSISMLKTDSSIQTHCPRWEKLLSKKFVIAVTEENPTSLKLKLRSRLQTQQRKSPSQPL
jgi:hypothetical protein